MSDRYPLDMSALVDFVNARVDEGEQIARAAIADDCGQDGGFEDMEWLIDGHFGFRFADDAAKMIATFAVPRRILRDVAAKRSHITRWQKIDDLFFAYQPTDAVHNELLAVRRAYMLVILDDATVYADHPDYRTEWKPVVDHVRD